MRGRWIFRFYFVYLLAFQFYSGVSFTWTKNRMLYESKAHSVLSYSTQKNPHNNIETTNNEIIKKKPTLFIHTHKRLNSNEQEHERTTTYETE